MRPSNAKALSATGDVTTVDTHLKSVVLTSGSDAATLVVKAGGSGGTTILTLKSLATGSQAFDLGSVFCKGGVHATFTGTTPFATFIYE